MAVPEPKIADALVRHGEDLLKIFHEEYARSPVSRTTEFRRGKVAEWKQLLALLYGESAAENVILRARENTKLSVPPSGSLSEDGQGYDGWDFCSDAGFIGKIS
jgi:hypothetical protein